MFYDDLRDEPEEVEVLCPLDGHEALVRLRYLEAEHEVPVVEWCSRFDDEPIGCPCACVTAERSES